MQIVCEIILQLVLGIWFMSAYPIFAIARRFLDSLSGEQSIPEPIKSVLLQRTVSDMLFSGHQGFSGDSARRKFIEKLKIVHGAHPLQVLVWMLNADSISLEKTIYIRDDVEITLPLIIRELPHSLSYYDSSMTFPVYFSLLCSRFIVNFVFSGFNFYWAYSQIPSVVESNAISQFNVNQMNSSTTSAASAPHFSQFPHSGGIVGVSEKQQPGFNLYASLNPDERIPPIPPHHSKIQ